MAIIRSAPSSSTRAAQVLLEAENGYMPAHDGTAHAERLLATQACTTIDAEIS